MEYLTDEEQYKEILNNEEIERIKDPVLREIRHKYWVMFRDVLLDEGRISDDDLESETDRIRAMELIEIGRYKNTTL